MAYIEAHEELRTHPKTKRAARALGISRPQLMGHLLCLWFWALHHAEYGDLSAYDAEDIADGAEWEGDPDEFVTALLTCGPRGSAGFLVQDGTGIHIHDWADYGGKYITRRNQGRLRQQRKRERDALRAALRASIDPDERAQLEAALAAFDNDSITDESRVTNAQRGEERREEESRGQESRERLSTEGHGGGPESPGSRPMNGHAADLSRFNSDFLSQIGFNDPDPFMANVDPVLLGLWAWYYHCSAEARRTVRHWPSLINDRVRAGVKPSLRDREQAAFWRMLERCPSE